MVIRPCYLVESASILAIKNGIFCAGMCDMAGGIKYGEVNLVVYAGVNWLEAFTHGA